MRSRTPFSDFRGITSYSGAFTDLAGLNVMTKGHGASLQAAIYIDVLGYENC